jgi:hypothetical protein
MSLPGRDFFGVFGDGRGGGEAGEPRLANVLLYTLTYSEADRSHEKSFFIPFTWSRRQILGRPR